MGGAERRPDGRCGLAPELRREALAEFLPAHRGAEGKALGVLAIELLQPLDLIHRLDAFGDHVEAQLGSERDDGTDDRHLRMRHAAIVGHLHERGGDLDGVEREAVQVAERGMTGAEIV